MQALIDSVGPIQPNNRQDVALVQCALRLISAANGRPYLSGAIDGGYGTITGGAISAFQTDHGGDAVPIAPNVITPGGHTVQTMTRLLPPNLRDIRVLPGQRVIYLGRPAADASQSDQGIRNHPHLVVGFRERVADLVRAMHRDHGIVLSLTPTGARRTFAEQSRLGPPVTNAQAGESNHNYGRAVDIGFNGLIWFQRNANTNTDDHWLNRMASHDTDAATAFWDARDELALNRPFNLFRLRFERIHLQDFDDTNVSARRSLAAHLSNQSARNWQAPTHGRVYSCNLGGTTNTFVTVGTANQIWNGQATISANEIQRAGWIRPPALGGPPAGNLAATPPITQRDIAAVRRQLQEDFQAADRNFRTWAPVR